MQRTVPNVAVGDAFLRVLFQLFYSALDLFTADGLLQHAVAQREPAMCVAALHNRLTRVALLLDQPDFAASVLLTRLRLGVHDNTLSRAVVLAL